MKSRIIVLVAAAALLAAVSVRASTEPEALVKAAKGPVQLAFAVRKTKIKAGDSLWIKLQLKNIGKKKIPVADLVFKSPWGVHQNSRKRHGIYLEIVDAKGRQLPTRSGGEDVRYDWEAKPGDLHQLTPEERKELAELQEDLRRRGLTAQERRMAVIKWAGAQKRKRIETERKDPTKRYWLAPGASTATIAWVDRGPDQYEGRSDDDAALRGGFMQLWSYEFLQPGSYRIRAVYDHRQSESNEELAEKYGVAPDASWVEFRTPFVEFEVRR